MKGFTKQTMSTFVVFLLAVFVLFGIATPSFASYDSAKMMSKGVVNSSYKANKMSKTKKVSNGMLVSSVASEYKKMRIMLLMRVLEESDEQTVMMFAELLEKWEDRIPTSNPNYEIFVMLQEFVIDLLESDMDDDLPNIVEIASSDDDFSLLVDIVTELDLVDTLSNDGPFTVFAPTNEAFTNLLDELGLTLEDLLNDPDLLETILLYHVIPGKVMASDVLDLQQGTLVETVQGESVQVDNVGGVAIDESNVVTTDLKASNGVVHVIDAVLLPASVRDALDLEQIRGEDDIVTVADDSGSFPTLVAAIQAADLVDILQGDGPFTVFAPTEEAFADLLEELDMTAQELLDDTDLLTSVLTYHVLPGFYTADDVSSLSFPAEVMTVEGSDITIDQDGGSLFVNMSEIIDTDIKASNGIIHVIDAVLLP